MDPMSIKGSTVDPSDPRTGTLGRATGVVYWFLVVELCFLLAAAPGFIGLLLLERDASNIPLFALMLVPVAPAFSAALHALARRTADSDLVIWPRFWHGWLMGVVDVLKIWVPALVLGAVLAINVVVGAAAGVGVGLRVASGVLLALVAVWSVVAVVIATFFRFRARDTARLALYYLAAKPLAALGVASFLVVVVGLIALTSDWVAALAGSLLAAFLLVVVRPILEDCRERFVEPESD